MLLVAAIVGDHVNTQKIFIVACLWATTCLGGISPPVPIRPDMDVPLLFDWSSSAVITGQVEGGAQVLLVSGTRTRQAIWVALESHFEKEGLEVISCAADVEGVAPGRFNITVTDAEDHRRDLPVEVRSSSSEIKRAGVWRFVKSGGGPACDDLNGSMLAYPTNGNWRHSIVSNLTGILTWQYEDRSTTNGTVFLASFTNGVASGVWYRWTRDSALEKMTFENGRMNGRSWLWLPPCRLKSERCRKTAVMVHDYRDGELDGLALRWNYLGQLLSAAHNRRGLPYGLFLGVDQGGDVQEILLDFEGEQFGERLDSER